METTMTTGTVCIDEEPFDPFAYLMEMAANDEPNSFELEREAALAKIPALAADALVKAQAYIKAETTLLSPHPRKLHQQLNRASTIARDKLWTICCELQSTARAARVHLGCDDLYEAILYRIGTRCFDRKEANRRWMVHNRVMNRLAELASGNYTA